MKDLFTIIATYDEQARKIIEEANEKAYSIIQNAKNEAEEKLANAQIEFELAERKLKEDYIEKYNTLLSIHEKDFDKKISALKELFNKNKSRAIDACIDILKQTR